MSLKYITSKKYIQDGCRWVRGWFRL